MGFRTNMENVAKIMGDTKIVPVVKIDDATKAVPLARAILDGGLNIIEVTFRTEAAASAIASIARELPEITVGAGTVLNPTLAKSALDSGARFLVSPGLNPATVDFALHNQIPIIPGVATASEIEQALMMDLSLLKLFPASVLGGTDILKAYAGPFGSVRFMPTGGITQENFMDYLAQKNVSCVGGSWMVKGDMVKENRWSEITALVRAAVGRRDGTVTV